MQGGRRRVLRMALAALAAAALLCPLAPRAQAQGEHIRVGIMYGDPQFLSVDGTGKLSGYAYEYMQMLAQYEGWQLTYLRGSMEECRRRLLSGEIDLIAGIPAGQGRELLLSPLTMSVVHRNYLQPLYLAVRADNEKFARQLFETEQQVLIDYPNGQHYLEEKYFRAKERGNPLVLTMSEAAYLKQRGPLRVAVKPNSLPLSGMEEDGSFIGLEAVVLKRLADDLGLSYELVPMETSEAAYAMLADGSADIMLGVATDFGWADRHGIALTVPYMRQSYVQVTHRGREDSAPVIIAAPRGYFLSETYVRQHYPEEHIIWCKDTEETLRAVSEGSADGAFIEASVAHRYILHGGFYDLMTTGEVQLSYDVSLAVPATEEGRQLLAILNRELDTLPQNFTESLDMKSLVGSDHMQRFSAFVYNYPMQFFIGTLGLGLLAVLALMNIMRLRRRHMEELQDESFTDYWTKLHNWRWFMVTVPKLLAGELAAEARAGQCMLLRIDVQQTDPVTAGAKLSSLPNQVERLAVRLQADFPEVRSMAVAGLAGRVLAFCVYALPEGSSGRDVLDALEVDFSCRLEQRLHKYGQQENAASFQAVFFKAGFCRLRGPADFARAMRGSEMALSECYRLGQPLCIFGKKLEEKLLQRRQIETSMQKALSGGEFQVWYQPKYDLDTRETIGAEALVRWDSPEMGFLVPGVFIPIFEENGFVVRVDDFVLEETCKMQKRRLEAGQKTVCISVNQSRMHFLQKDYLQRMREIRDKYQLPEGLIELELTETAFSFIDHPDRRRHAIEVIEGLHEMGYKISMDDFGSGYSSLELLNLLPLDVMKLDRTLLGLEEDGRMEKILSASIDLGERLDMKVICEGVEESRQEKILLKYGCRFGQGYFYAKPMSGQDFEAFLEEH